MGKISTGKLLELYVDTIDKCGTYLLSEDDTVIGYNIFEEFDTGVISFLHVDVLQRLNDAGLISDEMVYKSSILRDLVLELQQGDEWNVNAVRNSPDWRRVLELSDEIKGYLVADKKALPSAE
ncbi:hypothetical protein [Paenibacillus sp. JJ-223]|uniref:hypothetical protein n=1 Tax=Paenibacillus sp. JJ-223 TaxID=2905647 RepID=UPI001F3F638E|nr:hypothetical protein [Paenibacillus sp. JJ-223]CAH1228310.1 hypothetical protein PAECIP111890_06267 [Paenibacillus sp. JJ-223]